MARLLNILIISSEVINVGEDAERRGSVLLVGERDDARLTFLFDPALEGDLRLNSAMIPVSEFISDSFMLPPGTFPHLPAFSAR